MRNGHLKKLVGFEEARKIVVEIFLEMFDEGAKCGTTDWALSQKGRKSRGANQASIARYFTSEPGAPWWGNLAFIAGARYCEVGHFADQQPQGR